MSQVGPSEVDRQNNTVKPQNGTTLPEGTASKTHQQSSSSNNPVPDQLRIKSGKKLHCRYWNPQTVSPRALVIVIHGFAEHLGPYDDLCRRLAAENMLAFGHDHMGHGLSDGVKAHVDSIDEYVVDVLNHVHLMREEHPQIPVFAVGHSMGGMILLASALKEPTIFDGIVLMAPLIFIDPALATPMKLWAARLFSRITPQLTVGALVTEHITRDQALVEEIKNDPLFYKGGIKCKWATATHTCLVDLNKRLGYMKVPFLVLHGDEDKLCNIEGSKALYEKAPVKDKTFKIFPKAFHHLYREILDVREESLTDTVQWIAKRIPSAGGS